MIRDGWGISQVNHAALITETYQSRFFLFRCDAHQVDLHELIGKVSLKEHRLVLN